MPASIDIQNLFFSYNNDKAVLNNLNLHVEAGEKLGIIGPMGSGKSTLLLHLNGILSGQGIVKIGGVEVVKKNLPAIRRMVGLVFQNPDDQLFNPTVEEDIAFGPENFGFGSQEIKTRVDYALEMMQLKGFEKLSSHHLSMGERKRVALATVIALKPEVIAFDEPFASLDVSMIKQLIELINTIDSTLVVISHSIIPLVACCDSLAVLNKGTIVAKGTVADILKDTALMKSNGMDLSFYKGIFKSLFE